MDWKKMGKALLFPPVWVMAILTLISGAGLTAVFVKGWETSAAAIVLYVLSFYTLTVVCVYCARVLPKRGALAKQKIYSNPIGNRYMTDRAFRARISLHISLAINLVYVVMNLISWHENRSWWFIILAVYYGTLAIMRYLLVHYVRTHEIGRDRQAELKLSAVCGAILLTLNFFLSGAVLMIVYQDKGYAYNGIMIYVMAMYTFYQTGHSIVDVLKYRKLGSQMMTTAKVVSLSAALVSMLNLETAMFAQFGADMPVESQRLMIMLTGAGVAISVIAMAVVTIVRSVREIKRDGSV